MGGGFAEHGIEGMYFPNSSFEGDPAFTRHDVRIDFDWGKLRPIGGSHTPGFKDFPRDEFSVRWKGQLNPRFSGAHTFKLRADGNVALTIGIQGADKQQEFESKDGGLSAQVELTEGKLYDIQVEYQHARGAARCQLSWSSEHFREEVVAPVVSSGLNIASWYGTIFADRIREIRYSDQKRDVDVRGWPTKDNFQLVIGEYPGGGLPVLAGTYLLRFKGKAQVALVCCESGSRFRVGNKTYGGTLPRGVGYDKKTNTTSAYMVLEGSRIFARFTETSRGSGKSGAGVTDIQLMRPISQGSNEVHPVGSVVYRPMAEAIARHHTTLRYLGAANHGEERTWSDRILPGYAFFQKDFRENYESLIMLANETGKDLYLTLPVLVDDDYLNKVALLLQYGSDGREPYTKPVSTPAYPPLNPNLKVYFEVGNEIWNWAFKSTQLARQAAQESAKAQSEDWKIINFDGAIDKPGEIVGVRRWHALRTVRASQIFRNVFEDEFDRVRPLVLYQYDDRQGTASISLRFIDDYFNNVGGRFVNEPHPPAYHIWGSGGATYYGVGNPKGKQDDIKFSNGSFESPDLSNQTAKRGPAESGWKFTGNAGIYRVESKVDAVGPLKNAPVPEEGNQAAFLFGSSSISQTLRFDRPGRFAIAFRAAGEARMRLANFQILIGEKALGPVEQNRILPGSRATIEGYARNITSLGEEYGSLVFEVDAPGQRTFTFQGLSPEDRYVALDQIEVRDVDALVDSGFDSGEAIGLEAKSEALEEKLRKKATFARSFGLQVVGYEAGWSVGGDFKQQPMQNWAKYLHPGTVELNDQAIDRFLAMDGFLQVWGVHRFFPDHDFEHAGDYSVMKSIRTFTLRPQPEVEFGNAIPAELSADDAHWSVSPPKARAATLGILQGCAEASEDTDGRSGWASFLVRADEAADRTIQISGSGLNNVRLFIDGAPIEVESKGGDVTANQRMYVGLHSVRVVLPPGAKIQKLSIR